MHVKKLVNRARIFKAMCLAAILTVWMAVPAYAQSTTDGVKTAVTPYFADLKQFAIDMVPLVLGVAIVGIAFGLGRSWLRRAKG